MAYRLTNKTVLRAGFGIIYAQDDSFSSQSARWMNQSPDFVEYSFATLDRINPLLILQNGFPRRAIAGHFGAWSGCRRDQHPEPDDARSILRAVVLRPAA